MSNPVASPIEKKEIGVIGLGKMGKGVASLLSEKGWTVIAYNRTFEKTKELAQEYKISPVGNIKELVASFSSSPRVIWTMLPAGYAVDQMLFGEDGLVHHLDAGDIIIDAGNSFYKDAKLRAEKLSEKGIHFFDIGVSGGPSGARNGACLMIGGQQELFDYLTPLYEDLSIKEGFAFFPGLGAGHFVKMVHNGIEYGMMQAIGEGFNVMKESDYNLNLEEVSRIYNRGSVIESRLVGWLGKAYAEFGQNLEEISGSISHSGEGKWTVETAQDMAQPVPVIKDSYEFRVESQGKPSYVGKVVSALRGQFGGHSVGKIVRRPPLEDGGQSVKK